MKAFAIQREWHSLARMTQTIFAVTTLVLMSSISWADDEAVLEKCDAPKGTIAVALTAAAIAHMAGSSAV